MSAPPEIRQEWQELVQEVLLHNRLYYQEDRPIVSDAEYDSLYHRLVFLESQHPELITPYSPTQRVGERSLEQFQKVDHLFPLYSLTNAFCTPELEKFVMSCRKALELPSEEELHWVAEHKIDGLTVALQYKQGNLKSASTRGDGRQGEDITHHVPFISGIPLRIPCQPPALVPELLEIRGEVFISKKDFQEMNRQCKEKGLELFSTARNAAAGTVRQLDIDLDIPRPLQFIVHGVFPQIADTYQKATQQLVEWGFCYQSGGQLCLGLDDLIDYYHNLQEIRDDIPYEIDGAVYKMNRFDFQDQLGYRTKTPRFAVAHKFPALQSTTVIKDIVIQVGRTGVLTPVACLRPVYVGGVCVARASLHNQDEITRKDIRIGDHVRIQRAGDVIPQVTEVIQPLRPKGTAPFEFPELCPVCQGPVLRLEGQVAYRCLQGVQCPAQAIWALRHLVSKAALNIKGLGPKQVKFLYQMDYLNSPADLFKLDSHKEVWMTLPGWGQKSVDQILSSIQESCHVAIDKLWYGLGIPQVGQATSLVLARAFPDLQAVKTLMHQLNQEQSQDEEFLTELEGVGPLIAQEIKVFFVAPGKVPLLEEFFSYLTPTPLKDISQVLKGKTVVFTGSFENGARSILEQQARQAGACVSSAVTKKTTYLICGQDPGQKREKAEKLGIPILSKQQWEEVLQNDTLDRE